MNGIHTSNESHISYWYSFISYWQGRYPGDSCLFIHTEHVRGDFRFYGL